MSKKAPCVDIKTDAMKDERFEVLGELAGYNRFEAFGRMYALWAWCTDRGLKDAPDDCKGYAVSDAIVARFLGSSGVKALLADGCDELALGVRFDAGRLYLRGTSEYVAKLRERRKTASAGGKARTDGPRDDDGRFVTETTFIQPEPSQTPARHPAASQPPPAPSSSSSSSPSSSGSRDPDRVGVVEIAIGRRANAPPAAAHPPTEDFDSSSWSPEPTDGNTFAALEASRLGVVVEHQLVRFRIHAKQKGWDRQRCADEWPGWLAIAHPAPEAVRNELSRVKRERDAKAARERERAEQIVAARRAEADREDCRRAVQEFLVTGPRNPAKEATG